MRLLILGPFACVAKYAQLKSVQAVNDTDYINSRLDQWTGCTFTGMELWYHCTESEPKVGRSSAQLLNFRVDCRGAQGNFQNLTLYEEGKRCGRLTYRKYRDSPDNLTVPTSPWLPLIYDYIVTVEKEDVLDLQCILLPFSLGNPIDGQKDWPVIFDLLQDGHTKSHFKFSAVRFHLLYPGNFWEACSGSVEALYDWKMTLSKSMNYSHWLQYSSPTLGLSEALPQVDLPCQPGEVFRADKDLLQIKVLEATSGSKHRKNLWLVELDPHFYGSTSGSRNFSVDFKLNINPDLPRETSSVTVELGVLMQNRWREFQLTLPVRPGGFDSDSKPLDSWVNWLMVLSIFIFLVAAACYVFRDKETAIGSSRTVELQLSTGSQ